MGSSRLPLLWRVFAVNAGLLAVASLLLAATPVTIHEPIALVEGIVLLAGVLAMAAANLLLLRPLFAPLERLVSRMQTVDLLRPGERLASGGGPEVDELVRSFNEMLDRLELERRESSRRALHAQEAERLRIAQGLHDEVGQVLTGVLLQLDALARDEPERRRADIDETKDAVREALDEVRRIAQELRPALLEHLGLVSALTELATRFGELSGIPVSTSFERELPPLSREVELAVYRVAQEGLTNVARHAGATRVALTLGRAGRRVQLSVTDDGRGFDEAAVADGRGGVRGMRERAVLVGGALTLGRAKGGGTAVRFEVPAG